MFLQSTVICTTAAPALGRLPLSHSLSMSPCYSIILWLSQVSLQQWKSTQRTCPPWQTCAWGLAFCSFCWGCARWRWESDSVLFASVGPAHVIAPCTCLYTTASHLNKRREKLMSLHLPVTTFQWGNWNLDETITATKHKRLYTN